VLISCPPSNIDEVTADDSKRLSGSQAGLPKGHDVHTGQPQQEGHGLEHRGDRRRGHGRRGRVQPRKAAACSWNLRNRPTISETGEPCELGEDPAPTG
jgi:hypothetical protein